MVELVIRFEGGVNKIQQVQPSTAEIAEKQAKDQVWSKVISWVKMGLVPEKAETTGKAKEVLVVQCSILKYSCSPRQQQELDRRCMAYMSPGVNGVRPMEFMPSK